LTGLQRIAIAETQNGGHRNRDMRLPGPDSGSARTNCAFAFLPLANTTWRLCAWSTTWFGDNITLVVDDEAGAFAGAAGA
jgi:hypothetical protein